MGDRPTWGNVEHPLSRPGLGQRLVLGRAPSASLPAVQGPACSRYVTSPAPSQGVHPGAVAACVLLTWALPQAWAPSPGPRAPSRASATARVRATQVSAARARGVQGGAGCLPGRGPGGPWGQSLGPRVDRSAIVSAWVRGRAGQVPLGPLNQQWKAQTRVSPQLWPPAPGSFEGPAVEGGGWL